MVLALVAGLALGAVAGRYAFEAWSTYQYDTMKQRLESELAVTHARLAEAQAKADVLSGNLLVEQSTSKGLAASLETAQAELGVARDQLAFFDQLFPPGPQGAVNIRAFEAEVRGNDVHYRALFMRNAKTGDTFEGRMEFVAQGKASDKDVKVILEPARAMPVAPAASVPNLDPASGVVTDAKGAPLDGGAGAMKAASAAAAARNGGKAAAGANGAVNPLRLEFDEFQRSVGLLSLPEGFTPEKLTLNVLEGDAIRATRTVEIEAAP